MNNLIYIIGTPTVGKTFSINLLKEENLLKEFEIISEDALLLKDIHFLSNKKIPWFSSILEFVQWKTIGKNRDKLKFLYQYENNKTVISNLFSKYNKEYQQKAIEYPKKKFIIDTGGYSFTRNLKNGFFIYFRFKKFSLFKKRFLERYSPTEKENFRIVAPLKDDNFLILNNLNLFDFYHMMDEEYLSLSDKTIYSHNELTNLLKNYLE